MTSLLASPLVVLLTGLALAIPKLTPPTLPFGVRVAAVRAAHPEVLRTRQVYMLRVAAAGVVVLAVCLIAQDNVVVAGVFANSLVLIHSVFYALANRRLRAIKRREWWQAEHRYGVTTDTTFRTDPVRVPLLWLLPAVGVLMLAVVLERWQFVPAIAALTVIAPLFVWALLRARPALDAAQPVGSARRYRVYLRGTARLVLLMVATVNLAVVLDGIPGWRIVAGLSNAAMIAAIVVWSVRVGQAGHRLRRKPGEESEDTGLTQRDDDKYWHMAGMMYVNRQDRAVLVPQRVGVFWTMNLGHPVSWVFFAALLTLAALAGFDVIDLPDRGEGC